MPDICFVKLEFALASDHVILGILTVIILFGSMRTAGTAWNFADIGVGLMAWTNFIAIVLLSPKVFAIYKDYERQRKLGIDPVFEPEDCGITNADLWDDIVNEKYADLRDAKWKAEGKTKAADKEA